MLEEMAKAAAARPRPGKRSAGSPGVELNQSPNLRSDASGDRLMASPPPSPPPSPPNGAKSGSVTFASADALRPASQHGASTEALDEAGQHRPNAWALLIAISKRPEVPLLFCWMSLGIEVVASVATGKDRFPRVRAPGSQETNEHEQWVFLVLVLLMTIFFTLATSVFIRLEANNWMLSKVMFLSIGTELVAAGSAAIVWVLMKSINLVAVGIFLPPVLLFSAHAYHLVRLPTCKPAAVQATTAHAAFHASPWLAAPWPFPDCLLGSVSQWAEGPPRAIVFTGNVGRDRQLLLEVLLIFLCIVGSTLTSALNDNPQIGLITGFSGLTILVTRCGVSKYFITYTFDAFSKGALCLAVFLTGLGLAILRFVLESDFVDESGLAAGTYFVLELLVSSLFIWRAHDWQLSRTVAINLTLSVMLILAGILVVIIKTERTLGLGMLMVWMLLVTSAGVGYLWSHRPAQSKYSWILPASLLVIAVTIMLVAIVMERGMLAFSVLFIIATLSLLAYGLSNTFAYHVRSNFILPVWAYDSTTGAFLQANSPVIAIFGGLWMLLLWAGVAVYSRVTTAPSLVSSFSVSLLYMYSMHAVHADQISLQRLCHDLTPEMVAQAVTVTKKRRAGSAALSAPPANAPIGAVSITMESPEKPTTINFGQITDTCAESSMLQFGAPAHAQVNRVFAELHNLLCKALQTLETQTDAAKASAATPQPSVEEVQSLQALKASFWTLQLETKSFSADLLLLLQMAAHYASAEQEKAMAGVLSLNPAGEDASAARIANWPRHQLALVTDMRAAWVAHGKGARNRRRSFTRLGLTMRPDQADSAGIDAQLGRTQRQILTELVSSMSSSVGPPSMSMLVSQSSANLGADVARFEDTTFTPALALDEAANGAICAGLDPTPNLVWERAIDLVQELSLDDPVVFQAGSEQIQPLAVQLGPELDALVERGQAEEETFWTALRLVLVQAGSATRVRRLFNSDQANVQGVYSIQLFSASRHRWETVVVDDRLPCRAPMETQTGGAAQPAQLLAWHCRSARVCELWVPLLHKAAAKFTGSYHTLAKMSVQDVVVMLVGGVLQSVPLQSFGPDLKRSWHDLDLWLKSGCLVLLEPKPTDRSTPSVEGDERRTSIGTGDDSSAGLLRGWHLAVALHDAGKLQLVFLQSPKRGRPPQMTLDDSALQGDDQGRHLSFANASAHRSGPKDSQRTAKWLGLLDIPLSCHAVHVVRSPAEWKETVLSGVVCTAEWEAENADAAQLPGDTPAGAEQGEGTSTTPRPSAPRKPRKKNPRECKFQLHPVAAAGETHEPCTSGMAISVLRLDGTAGSRMSEEVELEFSLISSSTVSSDADNGQDSGSAGSSDLLAHVPAQRASTFFADAPLVMMPTPGQVYVFVVKLKDGQAPPKPISFSALVHSPQRMLVSQFFSDKERLQAVACIAREMRRHSDSKKLIKLKRREFRRRKGLEELVDVHKRFLEMLRVLRDLWRHEIFRLTHLDDNSSADDLVNSIFPSLDSICYMSERFYGVLSSCNHGYHPLISKQNADHTGFANILIAKLKEMRRKQWHAPAAKGGASQPPIPEGAVRLELTVSESFEKLRAQQVTGSFESAFVSELAAALKVPERVVALRHVSESSDSVPSEALGQKGTQPKRGSLAAAAAVVGINLPPARGSTATRGSVPAQARPVVVAVFDLLPWLVQQDEGREPKGHPSRLDLLAAKMAVNRRVDALAAALSLEADVVNAPRVDLHGPLATSKLLLQGSATKIVDRAAGLRQVAADGQRTVVVPIDMDTLLSSIPLSQESWVTLVQRFTPSKAVQGVDPEVIVRRAMTTARTERCTVGQLSRVLHYAGTASLGEAFSMYAEYFKVFQEYCNNLDYARNRVDACKKLDVFKRAFKQCQEDPRSRGMDLHNWLQRPNQHLMRQPLLLEAILGNTQKDHPGHASMHTALEKIKVVVAQIDSAKEIHEQRLRLVQLHQRLRGDFEDLVVPARNLVREASVQEVARKANKTARTNVMNDSSLSNSLPTQGDGGSRHHSFKGAAGATHHYAFLCNDSLWFCEVLRGNKYKVLHTFHFKSTDPQSAMGAKPPSAQDAKALPPTTDVQQSGPSSFWVSDSTLSVHLRLAGGEDADVWVQAIDEATSVAVAEEKPLETPPESAAPTNAPPIPEQEGGQQTPQLAAPLVETSARPAPSGTKPLPPNMPKPSTRYISAYRARHGLQDKEREGLASTRENDVGDSVREVTPGIHGGAKF